MRLKIMFLLFVANVFCSGADEAQPKSFVSRAPYYANSPNLDLEPLNYQLVDWLGDAAIYGENPVGRLNSMFNEGKYAFLLAAASSNKKNIIDLDDLEPKYNKLKGPVEAIMRKYGPKIQLEYKNDYDALDKSLRDSDPRQYQENLREAYTIREEKKGNLFAPLLNPNSGLSKWARYAQDSDLRSLARVYGKQFPDLPSLPEDPADLAPGGAFDQTMADYADKVETARNQATIALAASGLMK